MQIIGVQVVRDQIVKSSFEYLGELSLDSHRVVVHRDDSVNTCEPEHLGIEPRRERLAIELLQILDVAIEMGSALAVPRPPILCAIEEIGLDEHYRCRTIVLGCSGDEQVPHRK